MASRTRKAEKTSDVHGVLELDEKGHGFLRDSARNYRVQPKDPFVSASLVREYRLR